MIAEMWLGLPRTSEAARDAGAVLKNQGVTDTPRDVPRWPKWHANRVRAFPGARTLGDPGARRVTGSRLSNGIERVTFPERRRGADHLLGHAADPQAECRAPARRLVFLPALKRPVTATSSPMGRRGRLAC